jgi:biopolymer transport protein ExbD
MVDLGFLLISFFVLTNTISQPKAMKLAMPDDSDITDPSVVPADKTLNVLLDADNKVYVYTGKEINNIKNTGSGRAIRAAIINKKNELKNKYGNDSGMVVLIKPTINSTYADVINALDEMLICDIKTYILVDASAAELKAIKQ